MSRRLATHYQPQEPGVAANHTIVFTTPSGVLRMEESITIDFSDGPFGVGSVDYTDIDIAAPT
jgi:hypothetical protein